MWALKTRPRWTAEGLLAIPPLLLTGLLLVFASWAAANPTLTVRDFESQDIYFAIDLHDPPDWHLAWNHSVTGIRVRDYFTVKENQIMLTHSHMPAFDAGLGHIPGRGRLESDGNGGYWVYDINSPIPQPGLLIRVGSERVNHTLVQGNNAWNLSEVAAGRRVVIGVEETP